MDRDGLSKCGQWGAQGDSGQRCPKQVDRRSGTKRERGFIELKDTVFSSVAGRKDAPAETRRSPAPQMRLPPDRGALPPCAQPLLARRRGTCGGPCTHGSLHVEASMCSPNKLAHHVPVFGRSLDERKPCIRWVMILSFSSTPPAVFGQSDATAPVGLHNVVFSEYSPLARTPDFLQRVLTPLAAQVIQRKLSDSGKAVAEQSVDLSKE